MFAVVLSNNFNQSSGDCDLECGGGRRVVRLALMCLRNQAWPIEIMLWGPGTWALNLGVHKGFHFGERVTSQFGADVDNIFNHPLFSPNQRAGGGCGDFALLGDFRLRVDPDTGNPLLIDKVNDVFSNPGFGRLSSSVAQDDVNNRPAVRLRLRIRF